MIMSDGGEGSEHAGGYTDPPRHAEPRRSHISAADGAMVAQDAETPTEAPQSHHSHAERQRMPTAARAEQGRTQSRINAGRVGYTYINMV